MPHEWQVEEDLAVMALIKKYGLNGWETDPLAMGLFARGISRGSVRMAMQNFLFLMGLPGGLNHPAMHQRQSFERHKGLSTEELWNLAKKENDA